MTESASIRLLERDVGPEDERIFALLCLALGVGEDPLVPELGQLLQSCPIGSGDAVGAGWAYCTGLLVVLRFALLGSAIGLSP